MSFAAVVKPIARILGIATTLLLLTACPQTTRPPAGPETPAVPTQPAADLRGATIYEVNPTASVVHILVYRGGTLARFGHNHVMTVQSLQGRIWSHPTATKSGFDLTFPVAQMIVDDPAARQAAGSDFPAEVPQADRDGTRKNMLRAETLDAEHYPNITLKSVRSGGTAQQPQFTARITIRGNSHDVMIAPTIKIEGASLTASGEFDIQQTDFGIKPFSAALGALEVQDKLHIKFNVVAQKKDAG
jgi:polyisoprenoid-binding protein YceI